MIEKRGFLLPFSLEQIIESAPKGRYLPYKMTKAEKKARNKAKKLLKQVRKNDWIDWDWDEGPYLKPKKKRVWVDDPEGATHPAWLVSARLDPTGTEFKDEQDD